MIKYNKEGAWESRGTMKNRNKRKNNSATRDSYGDDSRLKRVKLLQKYRRTDGGSKWIVLFGEKEKEMIKEEHPGRVIQGLDRSYFGGGGARRGIFNEELRNSEGTVTGEEGRIVGTEGQRVTIKRRGYQGTINRQKLFPRGEGEKDGRSDERRRG